MNKYIKLLAEHFPEHAERINALSSQEDSFSDLAKDYHDTHERLLRSDGDPGEKEALEARRNDLGDELRLAMENYGRV